MKKDEFLDKFVLKCINGAHKNKLIYLSTVLFSFKKNCFYSKKKKIKQEIIGSGNLKEVMINFSISFVCFFLNFLIVKMKYQ